VVKTFWLVRADREFSTERGYPQEIVKGWYTLGAGGVAQQDPIDRVVDVGF
jgi:hypothetical protein